MNNNENNHCNFFIDDTDELSTVWDQKIDSDLWKEGKKSLLWKNTLLFCKFISCK